MSNKKNNTVKLTVDSFSIEDFIVDGRTLTREEFCKKHDITNKKMRGILGGYKKLLSHFNLTTQKISSFESKQSPELFEDFVNEYLLKYQRIPLQKEVISAGIFTKQYILNCGGYKKLIESYGFEYNKGYGASHTFYKNESDMIIEFINLYGDSVPSSFELKNDYESKKISFWKAHIEHRFGTYSEFLIKCGYEIGCRGLYSYRELSKDGIMCDSKSELFIDNFLYDNNIIHEHHVRYSGVSNIIEQQYKCDWLLFDGTVVEYFGLYDKRNLEYRLKTESKLDVLKENNINYIAIYPNDLRRVNGLSIIFSKYLSKE